MQKPRVSEQVLDSSAILALILDEPGAEVVRQAIREGALTSSVNLSEVIARLSSEGSNREQISAQVTPLKIRVVEFSTEHAWQAGLLRPLTRDLGLSLGDRCCLSLAMELGLPVLTADRVWEQLDVGVDVVVCR